MQALTTLSNRRPIRRLYGRANNERSSEPLVGFASLADALKEQHFGSTMRPLVSGDESLIWRRLIVVR